MVGTRESDVIRISNHVSERDMDTLAIESPLSMELTHKGVTYPLGITMRTPGDDLDLTVGFLYSEGIIEEYKDTLKKKNHQNIVDSVKTARFQN